MLVMVDWEGVAKKNKIKKNNKYGINLQQFHYHDEASVLNR